MNYDVASTVSMVAFGLLAAVGLVVGAIGFLINIFTWLSRG